MQDDSKFHQAIEDFAGLPQMFARVEKAQRLKAEYMQGLPDPKTIEDKAERIAACKARLAAHLRALEEAYGPVRKPQPATEGRAAA
jgi:hypothetical protein